MENLREEGIRTRCWTRSERDGNEIQALHLATFPFFLPQPQIIGKNTLFHSLPKISCTCICFLLTLSLPLFYSSLLCFSSFHIVGLLDPKLPLDVYAFQSLPHSDWWQHLQPSPNTAGTQTLSTSYNIQKITKSTKTWQNPVGTQNGTSFGRVARVSASTQYPVITLFSTETSKFYLAAGSLRACPFGENPDQIFCILIIISLLLCCVLQAPKWISISESMFFWSALIDFNFALHGISHQSSLVLLFLHVPPHKGQRAPHPFREPSHFVGFFLPGLQKILHRGVQFLCSLDWPGGVGWLFGNSFGKNIPSQTNTSWGSSTSPNKTSNHFTTWLYITCIGGHWRFPHMEIQSC